MDAISRFAACEVDVDDVYFAQPHGNPTYFRGGHRGQPLETLMRDLTCPTKKTTDDDNLIRTS